MNYTLSYPSNPSGQATQISNQVSLPVNSQGQQTIVLTPQARSAGQVNSNSQTYPMVMQMGSSNAQVLYTYEHSGIHNKSNESCSSNSGIQGPVVLSPVSPVTNSLNLLKNNGNSPNNMNKVNTVNIPSQENNAGVGRALGEIFNVQTLPVMQNQGAVIQSNVPVTQSTCSNQGTNAGSAELAKLLSSLQSGAIQIVDTTYQGNNGNSTAVAVAGTCDQNEEKLVLDPNMYKILDGSGNFTVVRSSSAEQGNHIEHVMANEEYAMQKEMNR